MLRFMLDTNICIYAMKRRSDVLVAKLRGNDGSLCISSIILAELHYGIAKSNRRDQSLDVLDRFLALVEIKDFNTDAARHYGDIRAQLESVGEPNGAMDVLIAAHARSLGLTLVTNNQREFDRVPGLTVENWV